MVINDYKDELFRAVGKLEGILDEIFWDSPFKESKIYVNIFYKINDKPELSSTPNSDIDNLLSGFEEWR